MSGRAEFALQFERIFDALKRELRNDLNERTVNVLKEEFLETNQKELPDGTIDQKWNEKLEEIWQEKMERKIRDEDGMFTEGFETAMDQYLKDAIMILAIEVSGALDVPVDKALAQMMSPLHSGEVITTLKTRGIQKALQLELKRHLFSSAEPLTGAGTFASFTERKPASIAAETLETGLNAILDRMYDEFKSEHRSIGSLELKSIRTEDAGQNAIKLVVEVLNKDETTTTQYAEVLEMSQLETASMEALFKGKNDIESKSPELTKSFLISYECSDCGENIYKNIPPATLKDSDFVNEHYKTEMDEFSLLLYRIREYLTDQSIRDLPITSTLLGMQGPRDASTYTKERLFTNYILIFLSTEAT